jgi:phosphonate transport system substrate-binding protein
VSNKSPRNNTGWFSLLGFGLGVIGLLGLSSQAAPGRTGWPKELSFGVIPAEASQEISARFKPLVDHLERKLGLKVKAYLGADYAAVVVGLQSGKVDFAYLGPLSYVTAARQGGAEAFAREDTLKTGAGYSGVIVSKASSKIKKLEDARGKSFAFVDPQSASGYLLPMIHFLQDKKFKPEQFFKNVKFGGSHEANIEAVIDGDIDVAATNDREIEIAIKDGEIKSASDLNVLWKSQPIPTAPLAYRKELPASLKTALREAVLGFQDKKALERIGLKGFMPATDAEYEPIRKLEAIKKSLAQ